MIMKFSLPTLSLLFGVVMATLMSTTTTALPPLVVKGYKWFDSSTGQEFVVRGVDYFPRPNTGKLNFNSMDLYAEEHKHIWERDIAVLQELGVNAIRLYAVNASVNHDAFMCAMDAAGIYVMVALAHDCPKCAITKDESPTCYPPELKRQGQQVVAQFAKYNNTMAFSTGNEVNHYTPVSATAAWNAPCQKRFLRDIREYMASCSSSGMRKVPVGLVSADNDRKDLAMYHNCQTNQTDPYERAEWYGLNTYVYCDGNATEYKDALGLNLLQQSFESFRYSIPTLLTEFGCLSPSFSNKSHVYGQRNFLQAKWMLEQNEMRQQFAGGFAFEYSMEYDNAHQESPYPFHTFGKQAYGIGYFAPEDCDDIDIMCVYHKLPSFDALKSIFNHAHPINVTTMKQFHPDGNRDGPSKCPKDYPSLVSLDWTVVDEFPNLQCPSAKKDTPPHFSCAAPFSKHQQNHKENTLFGSWFTGIAVVVVPVILIVSAAVASFWVVRRGSNLYASYYSGESAALLSSTKVFPVASHEEGKDEGGVFVDGKYRSFQTTTSSDSSLSDSGQV